MVAQQYAAFGGLEIFSHHFSAHFLNRDLRFTAENVLGLGWIAQKGFNLCRAEVAGVDALCVER